MKTVVYTKTTDEQGQEVEIELAVLSPSGRIKQDAQIYSKAQYGVAVERGVKIKQEVDRFLRKMNLWDDERQKAYEKLHKGLLAGELKLEKGGIRKKEAKAIALQMVRDRAAMAELRSVWSQIEQNTADAISEQAYFNYLVAACTVYNDGRFEGNPFFTTDGEHYSVDVYIEKGNTQAAFDVAAKMSEAVYGKVQDVVSEFPENQFLRKYNFVDKDYNLIDKDGNRVDDKGRRIDEEGYFIDHATGGRVDVDGNPVDENGRYKVEFVPFLEDDEDEETSAPVGEAD